MKQRTKYAYAPIAIAAFTALAACAVLRGTRSVL
jgi:hypothetical protein